MLPEYICMEKIIILWSDCESRGASAPPAPLAQPPLILLYIYYNKKEYLVNFKLEIKNNTKNNR